jgi:hypothetical protein
MIAPQSTFAFNFNLRRYTKGKEDGDKAAGSSEKPSKKAKARVSSTRPDPIYFKKHGVSVCESRSLGFRASPAEPTDQFLGLLELDHISLT